MAVSTKKMKMEAPKMESDTYLDEESHKIGVDDKDRTSEAKPISFDPKPVVIPFKKTLYAVEKEGSSGTDSVANQNADDKTLESAEARRLAPKSALSTALVYGIPVATVCFLIGMRIGMVCMKNTHGSSLEILWEALKF